MNIDEHLGRFALANRELGLDLLPEHFNFKRPVAVTFWVLVRKEMSVHVFSLQVGSVVAADHAIRVDDRDQPHFKQVSELVANDLLRQDVVEEAVDNKRAVRFSRVLPAYNHDDGLLVVTVGLQVLV